MSTLPMGNGIAGLLQALTGREGYDMRQAERSVNEQQDRRDAMAGLPPRYEYGDVRTARDDVDYARENSQVNWRTAGQGGLVGLIGSLVNARKARKMGEQARGDLSKAMKEQERQRMEYYKNMPPAPEAKLSAFGEKSAWLEQAVERGDITPKEARSLLFPSGGQSITVETGGGPGPRPKLSADQEAFVTYDASGNPVWEARPVRGTDMDRERRSDEAQLVSGMASIGQLVEDEDFPDAVGMFQGSRFGRALNQIQDNPTYDMQRKAEMEVGKQVLSLGQKVLKGSQTEGEWNRIAQNFPKMTDSERVWKAWFQSALEVLSQENPDLAEQVRQKMSQGEPASTSGESVDAPGLSDAAKAILERANAGGRS